MKTNPSKLDAEPGFGRSLSFKERVLQVIAECWPGCPCPLVRQENEPTKEQVLSGICFWRSTSDGCLYTLVQLENGDCEWESSEVGSSK